MATDNERDEALRRMQDEAARKGLDPYALCEGCHQPIHTTGCTCMPKMRGRQGLLVHIDETAAWLENPIALRPQDVPPGIWRNIIERGRG